MNNQTITLLEKYEPKTLDSVVGQTNIVKILKGFIQTGNIPHMMFSGPPGVGKTTLARVLSRELFGKYWNKNIIMLNASSSRGIDIIRGEVKNSTMYQPIGDANYKIIFMDEADSLTKDAMLALRETMLRHQNITRFIFAVNNINKMIPPIQDRTQIFRFKNISHEEIKIHIMKIAKSEKINISPQHLMLVAVLSHGTMRRALNALQTLSVLDDITEPIIREIMDTTVDSEHSKKLLKQVLTKDVEKYEEYLFKLLYNNAFEPSEILQGVMDELISLGDPKALPAVVAIAEHDWRISQGASGIIQTRCALFKMNQMKQKPEMK